MIRLSWQRLRVNTWSHYGAIAQLGERLHGMQEVGGSIPPSSTRESVPCFNVLGPHRLEA